MKPITDLIAAAVVVQQEWQRLAIPIDKTHAMRTAIGKLDDAIAAAEAFMEPGEMVVSGDGETHWYSCPVCHSPVGPGYNCCPDCQKPLKRPA